MLVSTPNTGKVQYYSNKYDEATKTYDRSIVTEGSQAHRRRIDDKPFDPTFTGGLINNITWGPVDINFTLSYSLGGYLYDSAANTSASESIARVIGVPMLPTSSALTPEARRICPSIPTVVVLPFVPVTVSHGRPA